MASNEANEDDFFDDEVIVVEQAETEVLGSIYDDDMIEKYNDDNGRSRWRCKWCNKTFAGLNATKALFHVARVPGLNVKSCTAKIDNEYMNRYKKMYEKYNKKRKSLLQASQCADRAIVSHNSSTALSLDRTRGVKRTIDTAESSSTARGTLSGSSTLPSTDSLPKTTREQTSTTDSTTTGGTKYVQLMVHSGPNPSAESKLTMAISDLIHSCGLPFSLASDLKFRKVLQLAKASGSTYNPPSRNQVAGPLLDLNYDAYINKNKQVLLRDIDICGISFYADGATVKKMPLINILAAGCHTTSAVLEIVDCTEHMESGFKKDASYIASLLKPHVKEYETLSPSCTDVLFFDGAGNVQKAGRMIAVSYPRVCVCHGAEHVLSLFFSDVFKLSEFSFFNSICKRTYRLFGSGSRHGPYAMFQKYSRRHNGGKNIGLIRAAGTRMAGCAIVMQRFLRLKWAIVNTVNSPEFMKLKLFPGLCRLLATERMWNDMRLALQTLFPALVILRLADSNKPCMDRLYFYVRMMDRCVEKVRTLLNDLDDKYKAAEGRDCRSRMLHYFLDDDGQVDEFENDFSNVNSKEDDDDSDDEESEDEDLFYDATATETPKDSQETNMLNDDDSVETVDVQGYKCQLGDKVKDIWEKRRKNLVHEVSRSAWMVSPIPTVMKDAYDNHNGDDRLVLEKLLKKWFSHEVNHEKAKVGEMINVFWQEFEDFHSKSGVFENREHIWDTTDIRVGDSHIWHKKNTLRYTIYFGKFACRLCSKIVGIGAAERSWGAVKHLKTNKRSHLSGERVKKQATIFGSSCIEQARIARENSINSEKPIKLWMNEDFENEMDILADGGDNEDKNKPKRIFRNWEEDWEAAVLKKQDPINAARILQKYGGMQWYDPDKKLYFRSDERELEWTKTRGTAGRYCIKGYDENWDADDPERENSEELWEVSEDLRACIAEFYQLNKDRGVFVVTAEDANEDEPADDNDDE